MSPPKYGWGVLQPNHVCRWGTERGPPKHTHNLTLETIIPALCLRHSNEDIGTEVWFMWCLKTSNSRHVACHPDATLWHRPRIHNNSMNWLISTVRGCLHCWPCFPSHYITALFGSNWGQKTRLCEWWPLLVDWSKCNMEYLVCQLGTRVVLVLCFFLYVCFYLISIIFFIIFSTYCIYSWKSLFYIEYR